MNPVTDEAIVSALSDFFQRPAIQSNLAFLIERLPPNAQIYIAGGAPRNIVMGVLHGQGPPVADLDIFIGGLKSEFSLQTLMKGQTSRPTDLRGIRWQPAGSLLEYDLSQLSDFVGIQTGHLDPTLKNLLETIDFTVNSIAYDVRSQVLFENGSVAAIGKQELEFNSRLIPDKELMAYRILLMHHKTGFRLSRAVFHFLKQQLDLATAANLKGLLRAKQGKPMATAIMGEYDTLCKQASYEAYLDTL